MLGEVSHTAPLWEGGQRPQAEEVLGLILQGRGHPYGAATVPQDPSAKDESPTQTLWSTLGQGTLLFLPLPIP